MLVKAVVPKKEGCKKTGVSVIVTLWQRRGSSKWNVACLLVRVFLYAPVLCLVNARSD